MLEQWRTAVYKGQIYDNFKVSNLGRLINLNYRGTGKAKLAKLSDNGHGYLQVHFQKNKISKMFKVHKLVAEAFLPNPENKPFINHKIEGDDGKKINIVYINEDGTVDEEKSTIEWVTAKENNNYGTHNERMRKALTNGKLSKKVLQFTLDGEFVREWESAKEAGRNGFNQGNIVNCCNGKRKSHKGFRWCYA